MPTERELERFKKNLQKMRTTLVDQADHLEHDVHSGSEGEKRLNHMADAGTDTFELDFSMETLENKGNLVANIDRALGKMDHGEFGLCEECGKKIKIERLRAIPFAVNCIECQELLEQE